MVECAKAVDFESIYHGRVEIASLGLDVVSLVVAVAAALGTVAQGFYVRSQVREMRRELDLIGPVISVEIVMDFCHEKGADYGRIVPFVRVANRGRSDTTVTGCGLICESDKDLEHWLRYPFSTAITPYVDLAGQDRVRGHTDRAFRDPEPDSPTPGSG